MTTSEPSPNEVVLWLNRLTEAQPADHGRRITNLEAQNTVSTVALAALAQMIHNQKETLMASVEEFAARLDTASTAIGNRITDLTARVNEVVELIPAERRAAVEEALASLDDEAAKLEAWGKDAQNPVPVEGSGETPAPPADGGQPAPVEGGAIDNVEPAPVLGPDGDQPQG